ncbi:MAG: acyl carrier protein [Lachnospiraceae bacterium]|nr:acyl carrier protein [Lachnospiraceae bacterium]
MEQLMSILKGLRPDVDFEKEDKLIDNGVLDSFDLVALVGEINEAFDVEVEFEDMEPENFNSVKNMYAMIEKLQNEV